VKVHRKHFTKSLIETLSSQKEEEYAAGESSICSNMRQKIQDNISFGSKQKKVRQDILIFTIWPGDTNHE